MGMESDESNLLDAGGDYTWIKGVPLECVGSGLFPPLFFLFWKICVRFLLFFFFRACVFRSVSVLV